MLVVDDEELLQKASKSMLEYRGAIVLLADSGDTALEILRTCPVKPNLVVLDLSMPGMSGKETFAHIRKDHPDIPVVISSGYPVDSKDFESDTKPDGILRKPYTLAEFLVVVEAAIGH